MRKKMRYLPGFVDLIHSKIFNIRRLRVDIKHKNGHKCNNNNNNINGVPGGPP